MCPRAVRPSDRVVRASDRDRQRLRAGTREHHLLLLSQWQCDVPPAGIPVTAEE